VVSGLVPRLLVVGVTVHDVSVRALSLARGAELVGEVRLRVGSQLSLLVRVVDEGTNERSTEDDQ